MTVPLWLLWAAVAALALPALLDPPRQQDESARRRRARIWAPTAVALVVAVAVTVDSARVSEDELYDATDRAARSLNGTLGGGLQDRAEAAIEDALGHDVGVSGPVSGPWSSRATDLEREERYVVEGGDGSGPAVCLVARIASVIDSAGVNTGLAHTFLEVDGGRCQD